MSKYQFRGDIPIDIQNTLNQLLGRFQSVKDGLPELVKNSKDQYSRLGLTSKDDRVIVVIVNSSAYSIACLDFAGAAKEQFERWQKWSDPTANARNRAADIEGGHGNGGKAFMVRGSTSDAFFESVFDGRRSKMGYQNDRPEIQFRPGFAVESERPVNNLLVPSPSAALNATLAGLSVKFKDLPLAAQQVFERRQAFTLVQVNGVREWAHHRRETLRRQIADLAVALKMHPQAALSLDSCQIWLVIDGRVSGREPMAAEYPEPFNGFEEPLTIPVPESLMDPKTSDLIPTGEDDGEGRKLTLRTSARSLRTEDLRPLHIIRVRNARNIVAPWSVAHLSPGASSGFIFGELRVPGLEGDHVVGADRNALADTPLVRALEAWTAETISELADQVQKATAKDHRAEDRDRVNDSLSKLRDLMRRFLADRDRGSDGSGKGTLGNEIIIGPPPPPPPPKFGSTVTVIDVESDAKSLALAVGATVPIVAKAYEEQESGELWPVPGAALTIRIDPPGIIRANEDGTLTGEKVGTATVWYEPESGEAECNRVTIESVVCTGVAITDVPERLLLQGERVSLKVVYSTSGGPREDLISDASVDEIGMGRFNRFGVFTAGTREGSATVRIRYGSNPTDNATAVLRIGTERVVKRSRGGQDGGEIPLILLCGTEVPGMEQYPPEQRTIQGGEHQPTIIDFEPEFEHVIFINPDSKESIQARKGRGGRKAAAGIATDTYYHFIAMKCFEILKRLRIFEGSRDNALTELQFRERFATAETECAPFIEDAYKIAEGLEINGAKPS